MPLQVQFKKDDKLEDVKVVEVPKPTLNADDEVLVKFILNPVNGSDIESIQGFPGFAPSAYPAIAGFEGVATVEEVGKDVNRFKTGQRVVVIPDTDVDCAAANGTWSDYRVYKQCNLFPVPDNITDEAAAQAIANPVTAYGLLDKLNAPKGEYILQSAAASSLGRILIQFAKARGIKTINLVRHKDQIDDLKAIGADVVLNTEDGTDIVEEIKKITNGKGAYGAVDAVGGDLASKLSQVVRDDGTIILYSCLGGEQINISGNDLILRHVNYTGFFFTKYFRDIGKDKFDEVISKVFELFANEVKPLPGKCFPLEKITDALHQSLNSDKGEKVFLVHAQ
ncbi:NAD(P)-binding protein [Conidiobolus coronatus NRRL 28638]|uniref:NAD(P)-binding protein n=1 Tax=Conidiobolus coronatus (strain ATCC 28846 / CBS 209.66 / NRRL 28638) TaxID=796925 RepID=A0A137NXF6_CONC2|nr:NAD(P)-binding protein [Conidiobolus coronatus NRRL 28638]|eukprot:KXN67402.1 NAD(P)-binding protein [Conidiobolus coronatus NRRL 28638]